MNLMWRFQNKYVLFSMHLKNNKYFLAHKETNSKCGNENYLNLFP